VCTENLNPDVMVMKPAKDQMGPDASGRLNGARNRRILDDEVMDTLAPDRADQPFGKAILPW